MWITVRYVSLCKPGEVTGRHGRTWVEEGWTGRSETEGQHSGWYLVTHVRSCGETACPISRHMHVCVCRSVGDVGDRDGDDAHRRRLSLLWVARRRLRWCLSRTLRFWEIVASPSCSHRHSLPLSSPPPGRKREKTHKTHTHTHTHTQYMKEEQISFREDRSGMFCFFFCIVVVVFLQGQVIDLEHERC